jgi:hypothetical protein
MESDVLADNQRGDTEVRRRAAVVATTTTVWWYVDAGWGAAVWVRPSRR